MKVVDYLAIGVHFEDGYTWSIGVGLDLRHNAQAIADKLKEASEYCYPDQILLVESGISGPEVCEHWNLDKEYTGV
jgi:hypothetical protein